MTLKPGIRIVTAPHFHLPVDWSERLLIGSGVREVEGSFHCLDSWRPPIKEELSTLTSETEGPDSVEWASACIALFQLPEHLGAEWWSLLDASAEAMGSGRLPGFESYAGHVRDLLAFKGLNPPECASFNVTVRGALSAGAGSLGHDPKLWGAVNLGDEPTSIVLINLSIRQIATELQAQFSGEPLPTPAAELVSHFLRRCHDYPPFRLRIDPGQGYRLPNAGVIHASYAERRASPDVMLQIQSGGAD